MSESMGFATWFLQLKKPENYTTKCISFFDKSGNFFPQKI